MKGKKDYTLTTSAFSITIHWNSQVVTTQLCILIGVILLRVFATQAPVIKLCNVLCILDIAAIVLSLLIGSSFTSKDSEETEQKAANDTPQTETITPAKKETVRSNSKSSTSKTDEVIKNKVPLPSVTSTPKTNIQPEFIEPEPDIRESVIPDFFTSESFTPEPVTPKPFVPEPVAPEPVINTAASEALTKSLDEMTADDWDALFG